MADAATDVVIQAAETIQTAHINRHPSPTHDINPSTAASTKEPVVISPQSSSPAQSIATDEVPLSALRPQRRHPQMPPLPDLRFEQSYLASIKNASSPGAVAWITLKDQVFFPLLQGTVWALMLSGWHYLNRSTKFSGHSVGARIRRWWWGVNNWKIPTASLKPSLNDKQLANEVGDYYKAQFSHGALD